MPKPDNVKPVDIKLTIETCIECPKVREERTPQAGFASDYYCTLTGNKVMGYVEWQSDYKPVPENCPLRIK